MWRPRTRFGPGYTVSSARQRARWRGSRSRENEGLGSRPHTPALDDQQQLRSSLPLRDESSVLGLSLTMPLAARLDETPAAVVIPSRRGIPCGTGDRSRRVFPRRCLLPPWPRSSARRYSSFRNRQKPCRAVSLRIGKQPVNLFVAQRSQQSDAADEKEADEQNRRRVQAGMGHSAAGERSRRVSYRGMV